MMALARDLLTTGRRLLVLSWLSMVLAVLAVAPRSVAQPAAEAPPTAPTTAPPPSADEPDPTEAATTPRLAQDEAEKARDLPVLRVDVAGNRRVTNDDVLAYLKTRAGAAFSPETLTQDVRELWNSGFFDDIEVDLKRSEAGVTLRFLLRERPNVAEVQFVGNQELDEEDLSEAIELKANTILSQPAVRRSIQKIRDMYAENGYFLAEVTADVEPQKNNEVRVVFRVVEHGEVTVRRITFIGNEHISDEELRTVMYTGQAGFLAFGSGGPYRQDAFERDIAMLSALYYDRGFLAVSMSTPRVMLTPDRNGIEISLTIEEGPRFRIRQLRVFERGDDGQEVEPIGGRRNLRSMVRAKTGDYFNRAELLDDLGAIRTLYRDHGFAHVEGNPQTRLYEDTREVDIVVPIVRGPPVHFERIEMRGNSKTRDKVIRREMEIAEGELFHETNLERSRRRITALGYFERVDISTEEGSAPDQMTVYVEVSERPTGTFQVGVGFSSIENFIATAQVQQANLFGNGQNLSLQAQVSGLRQLINIRFYEPYFLDSVFSMSIDLFDQLRVFTDFSQQTRGGALTFGYPLIEPDLVASVTYSATLDEVSTQPQTTFLGTASTVSVFRRLPLANLFNDGFTSSIRPALTYDSRDNRLFPTAGIYLRGSSELATPLLASENEFLRHRLVGRFYYPLGAGFVAKLNSELEHVTSPNREGVPIFARSFLGGILDVRGFRWRSIGPRLPLMTLTDPNSSPILANLGGNLSYFQNLEVEFPLVETVGLRGVVFTDAGNAWNLESNYCKAARGGTVPSVQSPCFDGLDTLALLRTSWGFGFRWFSPLGPLRFEWGFPFQPLPTEESYVFEFTIGNFF